MSWRRVCESDKITENELYLFDSEGVKLMLTRLADGVRALTRVCPHRGADMRASQPRGGTITCDAHFWSFNLHDGSCRQVPEIKLGKFETKEEDGFVYVEI